jgi:hypothetical protein
MTNLHFGGVAALDDGNGFTSVDLVRRNRVTVQIANRLDCAALDAVFSLSNRTRISLAVDFNFIGFHGFLNGLTNVAHSHVNARFLSFI